MHFPTGLHLKHLHAIAVYPHYTTSHTLLSQGSIEINTFTYLIIPQVHHHLNLLFKASDQPEANSMPLIFLLLHPLVLISHPIPPCKKHDPRKV